MDKKCPECRCPVPEYMATYGDMVTLLMCFFVLLFAFSEIDAQKFEQVMQSFQGSAGILSGGKSLSDAPFVFDAMPEEKVSKPEEITEDLRELRETIQNYLDENELDVDIDVELETRGVVIRFPDRALFDPGKADLKTGSLPLLNFIAELLKEEQFSANVVRVEGHTDTVPINTLQFPSNWELSTARATNVIKYFIDSAGIDPTRLSASGYGEYYPIADNLTVEGRAKNRRVDVVVLSNFFGNVLPNK